MHGFLASCIGYLENTGSLNNLVHIFLMICSIKSDLCYCHHWSLSEWRSFKATVSIFQSSDFCLKAWYFFQSSDFWLVTNWSIIFLKAANWLAVQTLPAKFSANSTGFSWKHLLFFWFCRTHGIHLDIERIFKNMTFMGNVLVGLFHTALENQRMMGS